MHIFNILRHMAGEISHFEMDAYRVILTEASDLKLLWVVYVDAKYRPKLQYIPCDVGVLWFCGYIVVIYKNDHCHYHSEVEVVAMIVFIIYDYR